MPFMPSRRLIVRHAIVCIAFVLVYLLLNRPEVIFLSRIGFVTWYPAIGLMMALLLGVSPWYGPLVCLAGGLAGWLIYSQPLLSFGNTVAAAGIVACYAAAAYLLRAPLKIDLELRRRRDVVRYLLVSATAAAGATIIGVTCLIADHSITWSEYKSSALGWYLGDAIGLVGIAPFLLVHVFPHVRRWLVPTPFHLGPAESDSAGTKFTFAALAEATAQALTIAAVCWAMFRTNDGRYGPFYTCFVPVIWIAMRQGIRRVVVGLLALNFGIVVAMHVFPPTAIVFTKVALPYAGGAQDHNVLARLLFQFQDFFLDVVSDQPRIVPVHSLQRLGKNNFGQTVHFVGDFIVRSRGPISRHQFVSGSAENQGVGVAQHVFGIFVKFFPHDMPIQFFVGSLDEAIERYQIRNDHFAHYSFSIR